MIFQPRFNSKEFIIWAMNISYHMIQDILKHKRLVMKKIKKGLLLFWSSFWNAIKNCKKIESELTCVLSVIRYNNKYLVILRDLYMLHWEYDRHIWYRLSSLDSLISDFFGESWLLFLMFLYFILMKRLERTLNGGKISIGIENLWMS